MATKSLTYSEIVRLFGTIDDHKVAEIIDLNPSHDELEVVESYLAGLTDVMGSERRPLSGKAASIYDIVTRDEIDFEEEPPRG
jgi:predicted translin family RNA/ssDNA-binding protein